MLIYRVHIIFILSSVFNIVQDNVTMFVHYFLFVFSVQHHTRQCYNIRTITNLRGLLRSGRPATTSQGSKPTKYAIRNPHQGAQPRFTQMTEGKSLRDLNIRNMKLHPCISSIGESGIKILHRRWETVDMAHGVQMCLTLLYYLWFSPIISNHKISEILPESLRTMPAASTEHFFKRPVPLLHSSPMVTQVLSNLSRPINICNFKSISTYSKRRKEHVASHEHGGFEHVWCWKLAKTFTSGASKSQQEPACSRALSPASLRLRHEYTWIYKNIRRCIQSIPIKSIGVASKIQTISCSITKSSQVDLQRTLWLCSSGEMGLTVWHCLILLALCQLENKEIAWAKLCKPMGVYCFALQSSNSFAKVVCWWRAVTWHRKGPPPAIEVAPAILSVQLGSPIVLSLITEW